MNNTTDLGGDKPHLPPARWRPRPGAKLSQAPATTIAPVPPVAAQNQFAEQTAAEKPYEVGYGKPPKHSQFKKGASGNPRGRPKNSKGLKTIVREILCEKIDIRTPSGVKRVMKIEALMHRNLEGALKGSVPLSMLLSSQYAAAVPDTIDDDEPASAEDLSAADAAAFELLRPYLTGGRTPVEESSDQSPQVIQQTNDPVAADEDSQKRDSFPVKIPTSEMSISDWDREI